MNAFARISLARCMAACAASVLMSGTALAAGNAAAEQAQYEKERAFCESGKSQQDRATCLREAGAAREQAREGKLGGGTPKVQLRENALVRCRALPAKDVNDCVSRVEGEGQVSGSVAGGGVLKETITIVPASAPAQ